MSIPNNVSEEIVSILKTAYDKPIERVRALVELSRKYPDSKEDIIKAANRETRLQKMIESSSSMTLQEQIDFINTLGYEAPLKIRMSMIKALGGLANANPNRKNDIADVMRNLLNYEENPLTNQQNQQMFYQPPAPLLPIQSSPGSANFPNLPPLSPGPPPPLLRSYAMQPSSPLQNSRNNSSDSILPLNGGKHRTRKRIRRRKSKSKRSKKSKKSKKSRK
jgi:hypothetical protein